MDLMQLLILGLVQGLVEFLPVSSSGHLVLLPVLMGWDDQGLAYDIAAHLGTLVAVAGYYRRDLLLMSVDMLHQLRGGPVTPLARLGWAVTFGTIPVGLAGLLAHDFVAVNLRSTLVIAASTAGFGLLLWFADRRGARSRDEHSLNWRDILIIGGAQALAMIPGTSRSGITITAGLLCGFTRQAAAPAADADTRNRAAEQNPAPILSVLGMFHKLDPACSPRRDVEHILHSVMTLMGY